MSESVLIERQKEQLAEDGYFLVTQMLGATALIDLRELFTETALSEVPEGNFGDAGAFIAPSYYDRPLVNLLTWPKTLATLEQLGFPEPKLHNYYISTKPPGTTALPWHSDLFYEYHEKEPSELFLIYALHDTRPDNGCLRVVPGSHRWSHQERRVQPNDATSRPDETDVQLRAGDLFIGDRRILHATHANKTDSWRTCLTIAYAANFATLSEPIRSLIVQNPCLPPKGWWHEPENGIDSQLQTILPAYDGHAEPARLIQ